MVGVGKTTTALERAATVKRLDDQAQRQVVEADSDLALNGEPPVLIDEWQRVPPVWDAVKLAVDTAPSPGRFILTGSAATHVEMHTGAARITGLRMRPMTLSERGVATPTVSLATLLHGDRPELGGTSELGLEGYTDEIVRSGFPGIRRLDGRALRAQMDSYLDHIVTRDMAQAGLSVRRPATVRSWLRAYGAATATDASYEKIRDAATSDRADKPAKTTTLPYIDVLTDLRILDPVDAWTPGLNHLKRLTRSPKHHLADPALAARLQGVGRQKLLEGGTGAVEMPHDGVYLGALFESLATLCVRVFAQATEARVYHLRTYGGAHEVDLIVERPDGGVVAAEVKLSSTVDDGDVKHLEWLRGKIGDRLVDAVVICTGPHAYRRRDGVGVVPLALLGP